MHLSCAVSLELLHISATPNDFIDITNVSSAYKINSSKKLKSESLEAVLHEACPIINSVQCDRAGGSHTKVIFQLAKHVSIADKCFAWNCKCFNVKYGRKFAFIAFGILLTPQKTESKRATPKCGSRKYFDCHLPLVITPIKHYRLMPHRSL